MEIGYQIEEKINSKGDKVNSEIFRGRYIIFQLELRTGEIWELINYIFDMWENIGTKNQKVKNPKPLICSSSKSSPEMKLLLEYMTITPWRALKGVKDENIVKKILSRVKSAELSLDEMCEEFQK